MPRRYHAFEIACNLKLASLSGERIDFASFSRPWVYEQGAKAEDRPMLILKSAIAAGIVLLVLDALWLGLIVRDWIDDQLHELRREKLLLAPAILFYLLYAFALGFFAVAPVIDQGDWLQAALLGGVLGLVAYGTYNLTNLATINHWPWKMVIADMAWGAFVSAVSASAAVVGLKWLGLA